MEERLTVRTDAQMLRELEARARQRGMTTPQIAREAWARYLGWASGRDELAEFRDRDEALASELHRQGERLRGIEQRVGIRRGR